MAFVPDWLGSLGQSAYSWAGDNPLGALSLGVGAAGTGLGLYNQYQQQNKFEQAQKDALLRSQERQRLAESFSRMGPSAFAPNFSQNYLQSAYFRPAATFMAERGQTDGGAFRQSLADAAVKAEMDRLQLGNSIYGSRLGALGYGTPYGPRQTYPATGTVGALGQSLQQIQLMNALRNRNQMSQAPPNAASGPLSDQLRDQSSFNNWLYDPENQPSNINWNLGYQPGLVGQRMSGFSQYGFPSMGADSGAGAGDGRWGFSPMSVGGTNASPQIPGTSFYPDNLGL